MPKLRRLSGREVVIILQTFGFETISQKGSHVKLGRLSTDGEQQRLVVPVHGGKPIKVGTLRGIYRQATLYIPEEELQPHFYTD
jgi:predicted RNA binding protein YcfA (HicA-like mRNA interferase family)